MSTVVKLPLPLDVTSNQYPLSVTLVKDAEEKVKEFSTP